MPARERSGAGVIVDFDPVRARAVFISDAGIIGGGEFRDDRLRHATTDKDEEGERAEETVHGGQERNGRM